MGLKRIAIDEQLHKQIKVAASKEGVSIKDWAEAVLKQRLEKRFSVHPDSHWSDYTVSDMRVKDE